MAAPAGAGLADFVALLATGLGGCAAAAAVTCGVVLVARRFTAPSGPPAAVAIPAAALAAAGLVALADVAFRLGGSWSATVAARVGIVLAVAGVALPLRGTTGLDVAATALAVAITAATVVVGPRPAGSRAARRVPPRRRPVESGRQPARGEAIAGHLRQRFTRYHSPAGTDCIQGRINVEVVAGARAAHAHVGFCPPFPLVPAVEATTDYDGVEATVAAAEVLPWGVRVEVRLAEPADEPLEIPVDLLVRGPE